MALAKRLGPESTNQMPNPTQPRRMKADSAKFALILACCSCHPSSRVSCNDVGGLVVNVHHVAKSSGVYEISVSSEGSHWRLECLFENDSAMQCVRLEEVVGGSGLELIELIGAGSESPHDTWAFVVRRSTIEDNSLFCYTGPSDARVSVVSNGMLLLDEQIDPVYEAPCQASCNTSDVIDLDLNVG